MRSLTISASASALMLALAACGGGASTAPASVKSPAASSVAPAKPAVASGAAAAKPEASMAAPTTRGTLAVLSPKEGATVTSTDIPAQVQVTNFKLSPANVGRPDAPDQGHVHVMLDGDNMGVLFNFYTGPSFTLPGEAMKPGKHKLIFDLATNTHEDIPSTAKVVNIDYQPATPKPAPSAAPAAGAPEVKITSPRDGATVGPKFTLQVTPTNLTPALELEGKPNMKGFGHYHVFVDMNMEAMDMSHGDMMMSMAGMVGMPGSNTIPVDLSAWPNGKHTITVEPVQNDHTPIQGAKPAMVSITLQGAGSKA